MQRTRLYSFACAFALTAACAAGPDDRGGGPGGPDDDAGPRMDAPGWSPTDAGPRPDAGPPAASCQQVDLLFVIDNSPSMRPHQEALGAAFPGFVDAMFDSLPPNTSIHVGITTTSFFTGSCSESVMNCVTTATADTVQMHYVRPDEGDTGTNGEQGRLFEYGGRTFFEANTSGDREALKTWFTGAAVAAGERGCSFEMLSAGAGYAAHPANATHNAGFFRDDDTVLMVFILSDEPDKSPEGAMAYHDMLTAVKSRCGGDACILAAGIIDPCVMRPEVNNTVWQFLNAFGEAPMIGDIDDVAGYPRIVGDALARVVEQTCNEVILF